MTRALVLIALALTVAAIARVRRDARRWEAEDEYTEPVPMTWWPTQQDPDGRQWTYTAFDTTTGRGNSGTYLYNPATGVVVSAN